MKHEDPFDLHVLGTPPAFVLSQDQTLHLCFILAFVSGFVLVFLTPVLSLQLPFEFPLFFRLWSLTFASHFYLAVPFFKSFFALPAASASLSVPAALSAQNLYYHQPPEKSTT